MIDLVYIFRKLGRCNVRTICAHSASNISKRD